VAKRRVNYARQLLAESGIEKERIRMVNVGAADARPIADILKDMANTIMKLGPVQAKKDNLVTQETSR
jgi:coenzyme F420-reducing hydrogenase delta subunit